LSFILEGLQTAFRLIFSFDREVFRIVLFSLRVSSIAIIFASLVGIPLGFLLGVKEFWGKKFIVVLVNNALALPTVVVGLVIYSFISRVGPMGYFGLLYTPTAVIIGQFVLSMPIIIALTHSAIQGIDVKVRRTALTLGATEIQAAWSVIKEARYAVMSAIIAGFGRIIAEVGSAMMLGGNIKGTTRTMTTAISLETSKGEFGFGIALGIILLLISLSINILLGFLQSRKV
jgi:tungstate transport system permease protein